MSEFKGMKIYMAVDPQEDGTFFIKKSIRDGSLAVFDEENDAISQVKRNADSTELREGFIVRPETKEKIESEINRLTAIATKHATRSDELYEALESTNKELYLVINELNKYKTKDVRSDQLDPPELHDMETCHLNAVLLDKSRIEAEQDNG